MKNPELFHKTIGILVNAYFNNTLVYTYCEACAVGNLVASACNIKLIKQYGNIIPIGGTCGAWNDVIILGEGILYDQDNFPDDGTIENLLKTGYTLEELALIECAFYKGCVSNNIYKKTDKEHFNGLMSVCDILMKIHEATTEEIKEAKSLFVKELTV